MVSLLFESISNDSHTRAPLNEGPLVFNEAEKRIPWRLIVAQRNVIAHEYGEIKTERMYALVTEHIPDRGPE